MTPAEKQLAATLLRLASDEFSNHGCNDFGLPNTDENWAMVVSMRRLDGWRDDDMPERPTPGKQINVDDWVLMQYLAGRLTEA